MGWKIQDLPTFYYTLSLTLNSDRDCPLDSKNWGKMKKGLGNTFFEGKGFTDKVLFKTHNKDYKVSK